MTKLPGTIDLVSEPPILHSPRLFTPILFAFPRPLCIAGFVRILHPFAGFIDRSQPCVDTEIWLYTDTLAILEELIGAETIRLQISPCVVRSRLSSGMAASYVLVDSIIVIVVTGAIHDRELLDAQQELFDDPSFVGDYPRRVDARHVSQMLLSARVRHVAKSAYDRGMRGPPIRLGFPTPVGRQGYR